MKGMTLIVKNISRLMTALIFLFGLYIVAFGHSGPGGGFAGGVILASAYILLMLAFGRDFVLKNLSPSMALVLGCLGLLLFIGIAIAGLCFDQGAFFWNFLQQKYPHFIESGQIAVAEVCIGLIVASLTYLVIISLWSFKPEKSRENES
ncbi:MAG: MnhB domain-containing protein [Planctomycetota bacterium]|jgi:multicomponent Na+:H+ antiporter subunit B